MEIDRFEREDIAHVQQQLNNEIIDQELEMTNVVRLEVVRMVGMILQDLLFDNTELLEQLRLEGEGDVWR